MATQTVAEEESAFPDLHTFVSRRTILAMAETLMQQWESSKQKYALSGTTQTDDFWAWIKHMKGHEAATQKKERVYLVISKLRRVAEGERRKVGSSGIDALRGSVPSSSMRSSASLRSSQSMYKRKDPSRHDRSHPDSDDSRDDISESSGSSDGETLDVKKQFKSALTVGAKMIVSAFSTHNSEASDDASDSSRTSLKRKRSSADHDGEHKRQRYAPRYTSPPGIVPNRAFRSSQDRASSSKIRVDQEPRGRQSSSAHPTDRRAGRSPSSQREDSPMRDSPWSSSRLRRPTKANPPPQSHFQGSKTSEQHWAIEVGGRYFELQVCKKLYGDGVKSFSRFTCIQRVGQEDQEITEKIYVGRTHMSHKVLKEIGSSPVLPHESAACMLIHYR